MADHVIHTAELHTRLRAWLLATMPYETPDAIASALMYELVSIVAAMADTPADARELLRQLADLGATQIATFGVGRSHP